MKAKGADWRTFDDWSKAGYKIKKGSKATWFYGVPMFARTQVEPSAYSQHRYGYPPDFDMEDDAEQAFAYGISPWGDLND